MPTTGNLFADLLKIGGGDVSAVSERLQQFRSYADTVPASVQVPSDSRQADAPGRGEPTQAACDR